VSGARSPDLLERLAAVTGVATEWVDAWNQPQVVSRDDLRAVLEALTGRHLASPIAVEEAIADLVSDVPVIEPVVVAWDGSLPDVPVRGGYTSAEVVLEDGTILPTSIHHGAIRVDPVLPFGYHRLEVDGGRTGSHILSAPAAAHQAPTGVLGLISPTYSLRASDADGGIGTVRDLRALADLCDRAGVAVIGTLPVLAAFDDQPSPYAPASRRAWNEVFADLTSLPGWTAASGSIDIDPEWVDYDRTGAAIRAELARYAAHVAVTPSLRGLVDEYLSREPEMRRYAAFRAMADAAGRNWRAWGQGVSPSPDRVSYHETVQWLMDSQLRELSRDLSERGQYLYVDLPIGCHPDGFDIWESPDLFAPASLGAPPDTLFVGGQDWGLPASIPRLSRAEGHANFRKAIRKQLSIAGLLRIDHVMGIHRTWWVPHGRGATQGAYVMQPTDEMFAIICIESVRAGAGVVGENLGTVPPEIRQGLKEHKLLGMAIAQDGVSEPARTDLVALSSHDTPAFAAWWKGSDIDDLEDLGVFDEERSAEERRVRAETIDRLRETLGTDGPVETRDALMAWMSGTDAAVALINLDDLLMEERRQNIPGTDWERPNWRLRHERTVDQLAADDGFVSRLSEFASLRP
jgi:4-alpha-glucanotransferase